MNSLYAWLRARGSVVLVAALLAAGAGAALTSRLPIKSDLSYLLPESATSVRQLRAIEKRAQVTATFLLGVESDDPALRAATTLRLLARLDRLPRSEVAAITSDDSVARTFVWNNRFLFADLTDLQRAADALKAELNAHNPLYVDLERDASAGAEGRAGDRQLADVRKKLDDAQARAEHPTPLISADGRLQLVLVRANFNDSDLDRGGRLATLLQQAIAEVARASGPMVKLGISADIIRGLVEQDGLVHGMVEATAITLIAVLAMLIYFFRSLAAVACLSWSLVVGCLVTFGITKLAIGHLNIASAFLSSIVIGNGINAGLVFLARFFEERAAGRAGEEAVRAAMVGTAHGTGAATLAAAVAYLSLTLTPFRGFFDFGVIGGLGMILCWLSAYTVLPASLLIFERRGWIVVRPRRKVVGWFERRLAPAPAKVLPVAAVLLLLAGMAAWRFATGSPLETNLRNIGSRSAELDRASVWTNKFDRAFGSGISGGFAIAIPRRQEVPAILSRLRAVDAGKPDERRLFSQISALDDLLPADQAAKVVLLGQVRRFVDRLESLVEPQDREALQRLRPPDDIRTLGDDDVPEALAWPYRERDGTRGRIILANSGRGIDTWHTDDLQKFTRAIKALDLDPEVLVGGASFVFADMMQALERDGPRTTIAAAIGAILTIFLITGVNRYALATIACGLFGTVVFLALAWIARLRINFLDFVALPITMGIGIDYAVNIITRSRDGERAGARDDGLHAASAVTLCSYTTIVGYGSLLISQNQGIRSFGVSAMLGEIACLGTALLVAPSLLRLLSRSPQNRS